MSSALLLRSLSASVSQPCWSLFQPLSQDWTRPSIPPTIFRILSEFFSSSSMEECTSQVASQGSPLTELLSPHRLTCSALGWPLRHLLYLWASSDPYCRTPRTRTSVSCPRPWWDWLSPSRSLGWSCTEPSSASACQTRPWRCLGRRALTARLPSWSGLACACSRSHFYCSCLRYIGVACWCFVSSILLWSLKNKQL